MASLEEKEAKKKERIQKLDELTDLILDDLVTQARNKRLTSSDRKLILDFLRQNGLNLDPNSIPDDVKGLLTSNVKFDEPDDDVLPMRRAQK